MRSDILSVHIKNATATVTLNRPQQHNALSTALYEEITKTFKELETTDDVRAIVLRGSGRRAFSAGADITEFERQRSTPEAARLSSDIVSSAEDAIASSTKPTIAAIHGYCVGGGAGLALACDIRLADTNAEFAITPAKLGLVYNSEATRRLVQAVGPSRAKWILFSARRIDATTAAAWGVFDTVHEPNELDQHVHDITNEMTNHAQFTVRASKAMVNRTAADAPINASWAEQVRMRSFNTADFKEGVRAFLEKRTPAFGSVAVDDVTLLQSL